MIECIALFLKEFNYEDHGRSCINYYLSSEFYNSIQIKEQNVTYNMYVSPTKVMPVTFNMAILTNNCVTYQLTPTVSEISVLKNQDENFVQSV